MSASHCPVLPRHSNEERHLEHSKNLYSNKVRDLLPVFCFYFFNCILVFSALFSCEFLHCREWYASESCSHLREEPVLHRVVASYFAHELLDAIFEVVLPRLIHDAQFSWVHCITNIKKV